MQGTKRSTDRDGIAAFWGRWGANLVVLLAVAFAGWAVVVASTASTDAKTASDKALATANQTKQLVLTITREQRERIDATCTISETKQKNDVDALRRTYEYLAGLTPAQFGEPLNRAVLAGLPNTIREATTDDAPSYCDKPGVGLPEPDPKLPRRPKNLPSG